MRYSYQDDMLKQPRKEVWNPEPEYLIQVLDSEVHSKVTMDVSWMCILLLCGSLMFLITVMCLKRAVRPSSAK